MYRAGAVTTLTISVLATLVLVLAATGKPAPRIEHERPAPQAISR
jgi:hypothetical protein